MKLHLGCGKRCIPGWVHIDAVEYPHIDHVSAIDRLPFIPSESVEMIYACHVLEHFKRAAVLDVLREWRRVLAPGGRLRLSVPSFESICQIYARTGNIRDVIGPLFGRQDYLYNIHYNVFDRQTLSRFLLEAGFCDVEDWDWKQV